jgi:hypothetical protein
LVSFAEQKALAEQRAQHADCRNRPAVIRRIIDEDMVYTCRPVENDLPPANEAAEHDFFVESFRRERQQRVLAQRPCDAAPRRRFDRSARRRRPNGSRFAEIWHRHLTGWPLRDRHCRLSSKVVAFLTRPASLWPSEPVIRGL